MCKKLFTCLIVCLLSGWSTTTIGLSEAALQSQRNQYLKAESHLSKRQWKRYEELKDQLRQYPLFPHLLYQEYEAKLSSLSSQDFHDFMNSYSDTSVAEKLRSRWLKAQASQENWVEYLKAYQPTNNVASQCDYLWASLQVKGNSELILKQIAPLWLSGKTPPKNCEAPFKHFEKSAIMTRAKVWQRIKLLIHADNPKLAKKMSRYLKADEIALVDLWLKVRENPMMITKQGYFKDKHPAHLEMIVDGVSLIAKNDPQKAIKLWKKIAKQYPFTERHWGLVVRAVGLKFANENHPDAEKWLSRVPAMYANQAVHEWRIRTALFREDWTKVLEWITLLPPHLAAQEEWQYWHARTLHALNRAQDSQTILRKLANIRSYYGILASHQLDKPHNIGDRQLMVERSLVNALSQRDSILRAREFYLMGRKHSAKSEWLFTTKRMSDKEKHAAARLAMKWKLPNWSILALSNADHKDDLSLRFPMAYTKQIINEAKHNKLDPAWIFAVARRESGFVPHAKSPSGALGVMQIMPNTAKMVAERKKIQLLDKSDLLEPHTNIRLGSSYLKMMLDRHENHPVLATAAYNAGPGRIKKWLPTFDMSADLWIETIPFKETREYVKSVLTYTAIYQEMLGRRSNIARYMPYVPRAEALYGRSSGLTYKPNKIKRVHPPR